jgi:hypothetical protein
VCLVGHLFKQSISRDAGDARDKREY